MHDDDLHDSDAGSDSLPLPGWVATGRGYTREVALESVGAGWAALIHFLFDRIERREGGVDRPAHALPVRGRTVAELRLLDEDLRGDPQRRHYAELVATGVIRPALDEGDPLADWPVPGEIALPPGTVATLIDEDRGDR